MTPTHVWYLRLAREDQQAGYLVLRRDGLERPDAVPVALQLETDEVETDECGNKYKTVLLEYRDRRMRGSSSSARPTTTRAASISCVVWRSTMDQRWEALLRGLGQLDERGLRRVLDYPGAMVYDAREGRHGNYDPDTGRY